MEESETTGLEEIGGSAGAASERTKIFAVRATDRREGASFEDFRGDAAKGADFFLALIFGPLWIKPKGHPAEKIKPKR